MTEHIVESSIAHRNCQLDENGYDQSTDVVIVIRSSLVSARELLCHIISRFVKWRVHFKHLM